MKLQPHAALVAIAVAGFTSAIAQIVTVRELLVLFYGNELSSGLVFTSWLVWTALGSALGGRYSHRFSPTGLTLALVLLLLALLLPATLMWIRATRVLWSIPVGELLPPVKMLAIALTTTAPLCITNGCCFALAWAVQADSPHRPQPLHIYLGEAAGAALGGLWLYFAVLPHVSVLAAILTNAIILWLTAAMLAHWSWQKGRFVWPLSVAAGLWMLVGLTLAVGLIRIEGMDHRSRHWQWGSNLLAAYDTPYHHLVLLQQPSQLSVFANGLWWFSWPDRQTAEYSAHPALLEHPGPRSVLVVGGGIAGLVAEILKHPTVEHIDYVEADPGVIGLLRKHLPDAASASLTDPRVHLHHRDATTYVRERHRRYDVVLLNSGDPMNLQVNRFYTVEFYRRLAAILEPGGIVSFAVGASADIVGPVQARFLRSLYASLQEVFADVMVFPGDTARFLAARETHRLTRDPRQLSERLRERGLDLQYVRADTLEDTLSPFRLQGLAAILAPALPTDSLTPAVQSNRDFVPICYFHNLLVWAAQLDGGILRGLLAIEQHRGGWLATGGILLLAAVAVTSILARSRPAAAVGFNVTVVGGALMSTEIVLLLAFQVFAGFVYRQVALIVASYMVGLALGAALLSRSADRLHRSRFWLLTCQGALCLFLTTLVAVLQGLQHWLDRPPRTSAELLLTLVFAALALFSGCLGGLHFSLAVGVIAGNRVASERVGGGLYGLDLLGAATGALLASLFLIPVYGIITTTYLSAAATGAGALALLPGKDKGMSGHG